MSNISKAKAEARRAYAQSLLQPQPKKRAITPEPRGDQAAGLGWARSVPRCANCKLVRAPMTVLHSHTRRLPVVLVPPVCTRGMFYTRESAICDHWTGSDGSKLEGSA